MVNGTPAVGSEAFRRFCALDLGKNETFRKCFAKIKQRSNQIGIMEEKRSGGLIALAVLNFVFAGFSALFLMAVFLFFDIMQAVVDTTADAIKQPSASILANMPIELWIMLFLALSTIVLLIVSGLGYLGQKKITGYIFGTLYGLVGCAIPIWSVVGLGEQIEWFTITLSIYPILTLVLLNATFRRNLVR
jgi:hypothetical protein